MRTFILLVAVLGTAGCCDDEEQHDAAATSAAAGSAPAPVASGQDAMANKAGALTLASCKAVDDNIGDWRPSKTTLLEAVRKIPSATCMPTVTIAEALAKCAEQVGVTTVEVMVDVVEYSACMHTVRALTWNDRHWVSINPFIGVGNEFCGQSYIYEITSAGPVAAYEGFLGASELCDPEQTNDTNVTSPALKQLWSKLPKKIREEFFCGSAEPAAQDPGGEKAIAFFKEQVAACNAHLVKVGNERPGVRRYDGSKRDPSRTIELRRKLSADRYELQDAQGTVLVVDLAKKIITAPGGATAALPLSYSFCQPEVFVGTLDH